MSKNVPRLPSGDHSTSLISLTEAIRSLEVFLKGARGTAHQIGYRTRDLE